MFLYAMTVLSSNDILTFVWDLTWNQKCDSEAVCFEIGYCLGGPLAEVVKSHLTRWMR